MNAIILSIGDELILGQTIDTNSAWLSQQLASVGCPVLSHISVADVQTIIERTIKESARKADMLLISGGIGPTADDLTRQALAAVMGQPLVLNEQWVQNLHQFFKARNRPMPEINKVQAMIPRTALMIENSAGTASGIHARLNFQDSATTSHSCEIFVMPGVPKEMKAMFQKYVLPRVALLTGGSVILSRTLHTFGLGESGIAEKLGDLMNRHRNPSVGTTVSGGIVSLRINSRFPDQEEAQRKIDETEAQCRKALGELIFGADDQTLSEVVANMLINPKAHGWQSNGPFTVTTAESCTGGLLAKMLTDIPGSSAYFKQGWIVYSNSAKYRLLNTSVGPEGAVSEQVVVSLAVNAASLAQSDFALAISGIAGPEGGSSSKPVGTVCIALVQRFAPTPQLPQPAHRSRLPHPGLFWRPGNDPRPLGKISLDDAEVSPAAKAAAVLAKPC
jgi:nicotinamide-nucleotide amidase